MEIDELIKEPVGEVKKCDGGVKRIRLLEVPKILNVAELKPIRMKLDVLSAKAEPLWRSYVGHMNCLAKKDEQNYRVMNSKRAQIGLVLSILIPVVEEKIMKKDSSDEFWSELQAVTKPLTMVLNEMAKYALAYVIIASEGKVASFDNVDTDVWYALGTYFCWEHEELLLLYIAEFANFTGRMGKTSDEWFAKGEAAIFRLDRKMDFSIEEVILHEDFKRSSPSYVQHRVGVRERISERIREFKDTYPRPAKATLTEWAAAFVEQFTAVSEFEKKLGELSMPWGNFCRAISTASGVANVETIKFAAFESALSDARVATFVHVLSSIHKFFGMYWQEFDSLSSATKAALLKEVRAGAMIRMLYFFMKAHQLNIPAWLVEYIHRHKSASTVLADICAELREASAYVPLNI